MSISDVFDDIKEAYEHEDEIINVRRVSRDRREEALAAVTPACECQGHVGERASEVMGDGRAGRERRSGQQRCDGCRKPRGCR